MTLKPLSSIVIEKGEAPEFSWDYEYETPWRWVIKHPTKDLYFTRWSGIFRKEPVWVSDIDHAATFRPEYHWGWEEGEGRLTMRRFRQKGCPCGWPTAVIIAMVPQQ